MEKINSLSNSIVKHGVQGIISINNPKNIFETLLLFIQDKDDRGRGDGEKNIGLPGGAIENNESPQQALFVRSMKKQAFI